MLEFREFFLSQFDRHVATGIIEFGKKLSHIKADVFLLMARKAACLVECLEELAITKLEGHVTTDRVLDMDMEWLRGKTVVIVDDAIVSGTTIHETIRQLKAVGVQSIDVVVLCINKKWFTPELMLDDNGNSYLQEPYMELKNEECIKLCSDIVTALSIFVRPYSVDFPMYRNMRIKENILDDIVTNYLWDCDNISSTLQSENGIFSITLSPNETFTNTFDTAIGFPISKTSLCKIRLYGKRVATSRDRYSRNQSTGGNAREIYTVKVVPMVVLKPIRREDIEKIFASLISSFPNFAAELSGNFTSASSKLRIIQHIAASYLGRLWIDRISHLTSSKISLVQDFRALSFLYPTPTIPVVESITSQVTPIFNYAEYNTVEVPFHPQPEYASKIKDLNLLSINAKLTEPFLNLYHTKEIKSRELVKKYGKSVFDNPEYRSIITRLKKGFPITFLQALIAPVSAEVDINKMVSLFLDKSVDMGIVVPITGEKDGILFRAYRHGEDVIFGELEEKLCSHMLLQFCSSSGREHIPHLWTEKLMVLLLKIGVHLKIFREFIYDNPPKEVTKVASVKNYLFGQVTQMQQLDPGVQEKNPVYLNEDQKSEWLSTVLLDKKMISNVKSGGQSFYKVNPLDTSDINSHAKLAAENIGDLFGSLYMKTGGSVLTDRDMVLLTSCLNPNDIAASMASEIFLFRSKWNNFKSYVNREGKDDAKFHEIATSIRVSNVFWTAVNSGQDKFKGYFDKRGHQLIRDVAEKFEQKIVRNTWLQFWSANLEWNETSISEDLKSLIQEEAHWLFAANIYLRVLDCLFRKMMELKGSDDTLVAQKLQQLDQIKADLSAINRSISDPKAKVTADKLAKLQATRKEKEKLQSELKRELKYLREGMEMIMEEIDQKISEMQKYCGTEDTSTVQFVDGVKAALRDRTFESFSARRLVNATIKKLDDLFMKSRLILDKVDLIVTSFGKVEYAIDYEHCLFIHVKHSNDHQRKELERVVDEVIFSFEKETFRYKERKAQATPSFYLLPFHQNPMGYGFFILGRGQFAKSRMYKLFVLLHQALREVANFGTLFLPELPSDSVIRIQAKNNKNIKFGFFKEKTANLIAQISDEFENFPQFVVATQVGDVSDVETEAMRDTERYLSPADTSEISIKQPYPAQIYLNVFKTPKMDSSFDIGILTIVGCEVNAVRQVILNHKIEPGKKTVRRYSKGFMQGENSFQHRVVMTQQLKQGNESVISAYRDLVDEFHPKLVILLGVAGGIHKDLNLCDVLLADQVIDYDKRKEATEEKKRGSTFQISARVRIFLNEFFNKYGEFPKFYAAPNSYEPEFVVLSGPIGSGNAVVGNPLSETKAWLTRFNDKTLAVETEAVGISSVYYEEDLKREDDKIGVLVIRGISDHADFDKDDQWRVPASVNAAAVLAKFVALLPNLADELKKL